VDREDPRPPAVRRGRHRAHEQDPLPLRKGRPARVPLHHLRRAQGRLRGPGARPRGGGRRPAAGGDDLRHPQRQGRGGGHRRGAVGLRPPPAADALRGHHRRLRSHALWPDRGRLLELGRPRAAALRGRQLLPGRQGHAALRGRALADRPVLCLQLPQRGPPERLRRVRRGPGDHGRPAGGVRGERPRRHRRRLLRHDPGPHQADLRPGRALPRPGPQRRPAAARDQGVLQRAGSCARPRRTSAGSRPWPSTRTPTSSWWASARTSPARRASAS